MKNRLSAGLISVVVFANMARISSAVDYQYDALHRLTHVTYENGASILYAYDAAGNLLKTESIGSLTVPARGAGTVTRTPAGATKVGTVYTLTAAPAPGFGFSHWTDESGAPAGTNKVKIFTMDASVLFTAHFTDVQKPAVMITAPSSNQRIVTNDPVTVRGTAADNGTVTGVFCRVNGGGWTNAVTTNSWKNWSVPVLLNAGSNLVQVYSLDSAGNSSQTSAVSCSRVVTGVLTIQTNGQGTVTRTPSGTPEVGVQYTLTAAPKTGYGFTGWTGDVTGTNKVFKFLMTSNRVFAAHFVDTQKPAAAITVPVASSRILAASGIFTVRGTASDNSALSNVLVQVNNGAWTEAGTTNGLKNWSASVTLTPGTNIIRAYSIDTAGGSSPTASVKCVYAVAGVLNILTNGSGQVAVAPSGVPEVGKVYTLTATAASGSVFSNWTGDVTGTVKTATFVMTSNKTVAANFTDIQKPLVTITYPTASLRVMTNGTVVLKGTASDNGTLNRVVFQLYGGAWTNAVTTNVWKNWTADYVPVSGLNTARVYGVDMQGNVSATSTVVFTYVPGAVMRVQTNGAGTVTPSYDGQVLEIGKNYTMTAAAKAGSVFTNWTFGTGGAVATNRPAVTFRMASNLVLTANFRSLTASAVLETEPAEIAADGSDKDWTAVPGERFSYSFGDVIITQKAAAVRSGSGVALLLTGCPFSVSDTVLVYFKLILAGEDAADRHTVDVWTSGSAVYSMVDGQSISGLNACLMNGVLEIKFPVEGASQITQVVIEEIICALRAGDGTLNELFRFVPPDTP